MLVQVTGDDIINGIPKDECRCAIARAIRRTLGAERVKVDIDSIQIDGREFCTPESVNDFIGAYDDLPAERGCRPNLDAATRCPVPIAVEVPDAEDDPRWFVPCVACGKDFRPSDLIRGLCEDDRWEDECETDDYDCWIDDDL